MATLEFIVSIKLFEDVERVFVRAPEPLDLTRKEIRL